MTVPVRVRAALVLAVLVGWLGIQLVVPAVQFVDRGGGARPRTFAWQMFSHHLRQPPENFTITTKNGTRPIDVSTMLTAPMRREILYAPTIVPELCKRPEIVSVHVHDAEWGDSDVRCR